MEHTNEPTLRELQLELQIWMEHKNYILSKSQALQAQTALLQLDMNKTEEEIARLTGLIKPRMVDKKEPEGANTTDAATTTADGVAKAA